MPRKSLPLVSVSSCPCHLTCRVCSALVNVSSCRQRLRQNSSQPQCRGSTYKVLEVEPMNSQGGSPAAASEAATEDASNNNYQLIFLMAATASVASCQLPGLLGPAAPVQPGQSASPDCQPWLTVSLHGMGLRAKDLRRFLLWASDHLGYSELRACWTTGKTCMLRGWPRNLW
ncbi:hypothetical protein V8C86DRAFT_3034157 [Haematococcus lacustris]